MPRLSPRRPATLTVALVVTLLLASCAVPGSHPGGARAMLDLELSSNGIQQDATYTSVATAQPGEGGLGSSSTTSTRLAISIVNGRTITDPARALDYLARVVWSIAGPRPTGDVEIAVAGGFEGTEAEWADAAQRVFGSKAVVSTGVAAPDADPADPLPLELRVPVSTMAKVYGTWPGPTVKKESFTQLG